MVLVVRNFALASVKYGSFFSKEIAIRGREGDIFTKTTTCRFFTLTVFQRNQKVIGKGEGLEVSHSPNKVAVGIETGAFHLESVLLPFDHLATLYEDKEL